MQALAGQFARMICEGGERVLGDLKDLVRGRKHASLKLDDIAKCFSKSGFIER